MNGEHQVVEKKLGMSLDDLIAEQKKSQGTRPAAAAKKKTPAKKAQPQKKGGGRVLVVPRPKHVPSPTSGLKGPRGGVKKAGPAPKFASRQQDGRRQAGNRNVKVTIGNKLAGNRPAAHVPTSGVLSKPFVGAGGGARGGRGPMQLEGLAGATLAARFDSLSGLASSGPSRPTGQPRRNVHGVLVP